MGVEAPPSDSDAALGSRRIFSSVSAQAGVGRWSGSNVHSFWSQASKPLGSSGRAALGFTANTAFCSKSSVGVLNGRSPVNSS